MHHTFKVKNIDQWQTFNNVIPYLGGIKPALFYFFVFISSLIESIPIIGTFTPGTILLLLFGFMSSHPHISIYIVIISAASGGVIGDMISYYLGRHSYKHITKISWVQKYAKLESGKAFFNRHGGKSILLARFIGPIRPIVPFLAGATHMPLRKFMFWNISGSLVWATIYITLGYFFGSNFRIFTVWASRAGIFAFILIVILVALYGWKEKKTQQALDNLENTGDIKIHPEPESK